MKGDLMMNILNKKIYSFVIFIVLSLFPFLVSALEIDSTNAILYNLNEDKVVFEKNSTEITSIASLTKIMTTIVAIENIDNLDEKITIKEKDFNGLYDASLAGFKVGEEVTYKDLLYGTMLPSGAEATQALANNISGSVSSFVDLMNQKVEELGMKQTHFVNTTGLDINNHYSTVSDIATLLKYCLKNETFKKIFESSSYKTSNGNLTFYSTFRYTAAKYNYKSDYILGAKTGYTDDAGKCLASTAYDSSNDILYLLVTTGANTDLSDAYHIKDATNIYTYYFQNYGYVNLVNKNDLLVSIKTKYGKDKYVNFYATDSISFYTNKEEFDKNKIKIIYDGIDLITYNNKKGEQVGKVNIYYDNEYINSLDIILDDEYQFSIINFLVQNKKITISVILGLILIFELIKRRCKN